MTHTRFNFSTLFIQDLIIGDLGEKWKMWLKFAKKYVVKIYDKRETECMMHKLWDQKTAAYSCGSSSALRYVIYVRKHPTVTWVYLETWIVSALCVSYADVDYNRLTNRLIIFQDRARAQIPGLIVIPDSAASMQRMLSEKFLLAILVYVYDTFFYAICESENFSLMTAKWKGNLISRASRYKSRLISTKIYLKDPR